MGKRREQTARNAGLGGETGSDPSWSGPSSSTYGRVPTAPLPEGAAIPGTKRGAKSPLKHRVAHPLKTSKRGH